jgi:hypothetical protein
MEKPTMSRKIFIAIIFVFSFVATILIFNTPKINAQDTTPTTPAPNRIEVAKNAAMTLSKEKCKDAGEQCGTCVQKNVLPQIFSEYRITNPREKSEINTAAVQGCSPGEPAT